jgi:hypothetical protein
LAKTIDPSGKYSRNKLNNCGLPMNTTRPVPVPTFLPFVKPAKDRMRVETAYSRLEIALTYAYLEGERHLPAELLASGCIAGRVRRDARGNAVFPHYDADGQYGYEIKNREFTGFA